MRSRILPSVFAALLLAQAATAPETPPAERVPPYLPVVPALPKPAPSTVYTPPAAAATPGAYAPPAAVSPVTGFGTGGMEHAPGTPANPPYAPGGIGH